MARGDNLPGIIQILDRLVVHGWVPLRSLGVLLGYKEVRGIYQRQRGKNAISIIQVGGVKRVYADVVIETLEKKQPTGDGFDPQTILARYRHMLKQKEEDD